MKSLLILLIFLGVCPVQAQTNFDVLYCKDAAYTNAIIIRSNASYVVVSHDRGLAKVYLTNLPTALQSFYHYDPDKAGEILAAEKKAQAESAAKLQAARIAQQKYLESIKGRTETITVKSAVNQQLPPGLTCLISCSQGNQRVLLAGIPGDVLQYVNAKNQILSDIEYQKNRVISVTSRVSNPNDPDQAGTAAFNSQMAYIDADNARKQKIRDLKDELQDLNDEPERAKVQAYPTGLQYSGMLIWQCGDSGK